MELFKANDTEINFTTIPHCRCMAKSQDKIDTKTPNYNKVIEGL